MFRKKKLANTRGRREKDMGPDRTPMRDLLREGIFRTELYSKLLEVIVNRLQSQTKEISESDLTLFVQQLFRVPVDEHRKLLEKARKNGLSQQCVVRVHVQKAEKLAAKDSNGLSDPYCMLSVLRNAQFVNLQTAKLSVVKSTSVKESTLSPEWNETFDIFVPRDEIDDCHVQIQLWDYDGNIQGSSKKLRGMKGMGRKMKEVVTNKDDEEDDFMGFNSVPLTKIPTEGLDSWFKLRPVHALQKVSGRIRFKLEFNPLVHSPGDAKHSDDVILAALLTAVVDRAYADFEAKRAEGSTEEWDGKLPRFGQTLIQAFSEQHLVKLLTRAIVRWEVYMGIHLKNEIGLDALFMDGLLKTLEANSQDLQEQEASSANIVQSRFTVDALGVSLFDFIKKELTKIKDHRNVFSAQQNNYIINLGNLLLIFKKIRNMKLYKKLHKRTPSPPTSPDVRDDVIASLVEGTEDYYVTLYDKMQDESLEEQDGENSGDESPFGGQEARIFIRIAEQLFRDLSFGQTMYHGVFAKILDIDYHSYIFRVVEKNLAKDISEIMYKVNKTLSLIDDPNNVESETKSILLFRLYLTMRDLSSLAKTAKILNIEIRSNSARSSIKSDTSNVSENGITVTDGADPNRNTTDLTRYYDWFRPTVIRWLQMSRGRTHDRLRKAVALDKTVAVDEIVKHTSSAVDTIGCLSGHVVAFWKSLSWPDPVDAYTIALRMTDDVANAIERYADLVHKKLKEVGFFDDVGRFDVTEELCLTLNNLQYVKSFVENLPEKMEFEAIAKSVDQHPEGLNADRVLTTFKSLTSVAKIGMDKKIHSITSVVGSKMKPDIRRFLRNYAQQATRCGYGADFHQNQDPASRKKLLGAANVAVRPLMEYLHENTRTLHEWLCEPSFKQILEVLWKVTVQSFRKLALSEYAEHRPFFFFQCRHVLNHHFVDFFHAEGSGISMNRMTSSEDYRILDSELKMRCAKTQDLMRLFYMQMYDEQQRLASNPLYGYINVHAWYDPLGEEINIDVISAHELKPLDVNGLSDPFVVVKIAPTMMFRHLREEQTLVVKKTLDPLFDNESFVFSVSKDLVQLDGAVLLITVLDHDVIGANDLEGESVLPLNMLDGVPSGSNGQTNKISRNFRLPLTQPGLWCTRTNKPKSKQVREANSQHTVSQTLSSLSSSFSGLKLNEDGLDFESTQNASPLILISARSSFDKDADEFARTRKRIKSIAEIDE